jgi:hypothetical protein
MHFVNELLKYVEPEIEDQPPDTISGREVDQSLEVIAASALFTLEQR